MAIRRSRLSDSELRALCEQEITSASAYSADLADERASAMDMYLGEPRGDEVPHRSSVHTREVFDNVEWCLPSLLRIFGDADNICIFEPQGPEDTEAAQQESDATQYVFWRQNQGFFNLYNFIKDALLSKTGILKVSWDDTPDESREEYEGLNDWELSELFADQSVEIEPLEFAQNDDGTYDITIKTIRSRGRVQITPCPPEEFGIARDARSIYPEDADFCYHRTRKSKAELVEMGFARKLVEELPSSVEDVLTQERLARRYLSDEREDYEHGNHWSMNRVWLTECYIRVDRDGDGIAELLKVTLAGQDSNYANGSTLLDVEEVDRQPFVVWSPILRTHTFYGLSMADMVMDLQDIKTSLTRQMLDSTYLANNGRMAVNERVNYDDLMTSRPGGIVRIEGSDPPAGALLPIPQQPVPVQSFEMLEYLDEMRKSRTGVGDDVGALDTNALANINTGVAAMAFDAARSKIELMARLCAEIGLRPLFLRIHELLRKNGEKEISMQLGRDWVQVQPQEWRERNDMVVQVGIGRVSRERRMTALSDILEKQTLVVQNGGLGVLLGPEHLHRALSDYTRELGVEESLYWMDPKEAQPKQKEPDPNMMALQLQAELGKGQIMAAREKNQVEMMKIQSQREIAASKEQSDQRELMIKSQIERIKQETAQMKAAADAGDQQAQLRIEFAEKRADNQVKALELRLEQEQEASKRAMDRYKVDTEAAVRIAVEQMKQDGSNVANASDQQFAELAAQVFELREKLGEERSKPRGGKVQRDADGLPIAIGDLSINYDDEGLIESIG
jgi:hypothetical protein